VKTPANLPHPRDSGRAPWEIVAAGTVSLDDVTTPAGRERESLGGSALYFAAAAHLLAPVHVTSVVGEDCRTLVALALKQPGIDLEGLEVVDRPTYRWNAVHDLASGRTTSEHSELGAMEAYSGRLTLPARRAPAAFLGSMDPRHQRTVLDQLESVRVVGADTMNKYIGEQREAVTAVLQRADLIFLNESEASHLAKIDDPEAAAARLFTRLTPLALILKRGARGAILFHGDRRVARPAVEVTRVVDPTGCGDAFAAGFLGELARRRTLDQRSLEAALGMALVMASFALEAFGIEGLRAATPERIRSRDAAQGQGALEAGG
jgi:sugar/nucleoside kinase (ribokinase family)